MIYSIFYLKNSNYQVLLSELSELIRNHNWIEFKFFSSISQFSPWYWTLPKAKSRAKTEINFLSIQTDHISQKMKKTKNVKPQTKHPYLKIKPKQPWVVHFIQFKHNGFLSQKGKMHQHCEFHWLETENICINYMKFY